MTQIGKVEIDYTHMTNTSNGRNAFYDVVRVRVAVEDGYYHERTWARWGKIGAVGQVQIKKEGPIDLIHAKQDRGYETYLSLREVDFEGFVEGAMKGTLDHPKLREDIECFIVKNGGSFTRSESSDLQFGVEFDEPDEERPAHQGTW